MAIGIGKELRKDAGKKLRRENTLINQRNNNGSALGQHTELKQSAI